ncbi:hypothetical protein QLX08_009512 [Tetragonisca angustula]|uniref:Uncharacterized protein n=1 Tax=Tetragonisca angustula TaxID=166442 RepID=A0AAW0ZGI7_9HYME
MDSRGMAHVPNRCADRNDDRYSQANNPPTLTFFAFTVNSFALHVCRLDLGLCFFFSSSHPVELLWPRVFNNTPTPSVVGKLWKVRNERSHARREEGEGGTMLLPE